MDVVQQNQFYRIDSSKTYSQPNKPLINKLLCRRVQSCQRQQYGKVRTIRRLT